MRKPAVLITALVACGLLASAAWAKPIKITEQQVRNICGSGLKSGSAGGQSGLGCEKNCGGKVCVYGCLTDKKGKKTCTGEVFLVGQGAPSSGAIGPGFLEASPGGGTTVGPSPTGTPAAPAAVPGRIN